LFEGLFKSRNSIEMEDLKTTFSATLSAVQGAMYKNVTELGWFRGNPLTARTMWATAGILLTVAGGFAAAFISSVAPIALILAPIPLLGIMVIATSRNAPARTAEGTRVLAQAEGFQTFLSTADGNKLRYEEGHDIFSMYLPYAIAFDVADKWAGVFAKLAKQGANLPDPTWYQGVAAGSFWTHSN